jgi:hypothetical protein
MAQNTFDPEKPQQMFDSYVPMAFQSDVIRMIVGAVDRAEKDCHSRFDEAEYHDMIGHWTRAEVESGLRKIAKKHKLDGQHEKNKRRTSNFSRVVSGPVVLTISQVNSPSELVRYAEFRRSYARDSQQVLFGPQKAPAPNAPLYALILFVRGEVIKNQPVRPISIRIVFPAPVDGVEKGIKYVGGAIDLMNRFPQVMAEFEPHKGDIRSIEQIQRPEPPPLRARKDVSA